MITDEHELIAASREALGIADGAEIRLGAIIAGGSLRSFHRVELDGAGHCVLMQYTPDYEENNYFVEIARFLDELGIGSPSILAADEERHMVWMEDLGGRDLYSLRAAPWDERCQAYKLALDVVGELHQKALPGLEGRNLRLMHGFDPGLYNWEHDYFFNNFVYRICHMADLRPSDDHLREEIDELTTRLCNAPAALVHRDFQSQNVILRGDRACLIDFQGLRHGTPFYDLGSLLYDPYVTFANHEREELLDYYLKTYELDTPDARSLFYDASSQRLMQALGAYGFLGQKEGKEHFLQHIPAALDNLATASIKSGRLDSLHDLVGRCREMLTRHPATPGDNAASGLMR